MINYAKNKGTNSMEEQLELLHFRITREIYQMNMKDMATMMMKIVKCFRLIDLSFRILALKKPMENIRIQKRMIKEVLINLTRFKIFEKQPKLLSNHMVAKEKLAECLSLKGTHHGYLRQYSTKEEEPRTQTSIMHSMQD